MTRLTLLLCALLLSACGFHLRGQATFAFHSIYIQSPAETPFVTTLKRGLKSNKVEVMEVPGKSDLTLEVAYELSDKQIIALSGSGHVIDYLLRYKVSLRAYDRQHDEWLPATEIALQRDLPYDDTQVLAKEQEAAMLYSEMRSDAAQQVLRQLSLAKPPQHEKP